MYPQPAPPADGSALFKFFTGENRERGFYVRLPALSYPELREQELNLQPLAAVAASALRH
jgi:hypothetical protein